MLKKIMNLFRCVVLLRKENLASHQDNLRLRHMLALLSFAYLTPANAEGISLRLSNTLNTPAEPSTEQPPPLPVYLRAQTIQGTSDDIFVLNGAAEIRQRKKNISANNLVLQKRPTPFIESNGPVYLKKSDDFTASGHNLNLNLESDTGTLQNPTITLSYRPPPKSWKTLKFNPEEQPELITGRGTGLQLDFEGPGLYRLRQARYTNCPIDDNSWYITTDNFLIDDNKGEAEAESGHLYFYDHLLFASPVGINFPLDDRRRSGLLAAQLISTSNSGLIVGLPYYFNLAPNYDLTATPRIFSKRGVSLGGDFRYMTDNRDGNARVEFLPNDPLFGQKNRYGIHIIDNAALSSQWTSRINYNKVSDYLYFNDLPNQLGIPISASNLVQEAQLNGYVHSTNVGIRIQQYQTLINPNNPSAVSVPYRRMPQITANWAQAGLTSSLDANIPSELTAFNHPTLTSGTRFVSYPQLSMPIHANGMHFIPKVGLNLAQYALNASTAADTTQASRAIPTFTADAGVVLERDNINWFGAHYQNTLEPRLYYVYVPYQDQSKIPSFDTGLRDFNFLQLFSENIYSGQDRIVNANQLTTGFSSRFITPETGQEQFRIQFAQRFYFTPQKVNIDNTDPLRTNNSSDILASISGQTFEHLTTNIMTQLGQRNQARLQQFSIGARYNPDYGRTLGVSYRYSVNQLQQLDLSYQWPINDHWSGVGRYNYVFRDLTVTPSRRDFTAELLLGVEYSSCCWISRFVLQRIPNLSGQYATSLFYQLELKGLTQLGMNPLSTLQQSIPGYQPARYYPTANAL